MEAQNKQLESIWGKWWEPLRKWFYPAWLIYETFIRFYSYSEDVYNYLLNKQELIVSYIGKIGAQILSLFCTSLTFLICIVFLTVPTSFVLFRFFKSYNMTGTKLENRFKKIL
ncbi:hypothetical protein [Seonamhaeicola marinus]|uniref:Uncharacterized protein n=1 Tax=Seonamhaeicola marinus TaxID=1912246 RepID=A0A5D0IMY1_9FLAO|nr:hypothetical protein [Seonamhaeicola marinus]TYA84389.1 hypothetical protein FUA24_07020 [Seonamhaeicola marinus]